MDIKVKCAQCGELIDNSDGRCPIDCPYCKEETTCPYCLSSLISVIIGGTVLKKCSSCDWRCCGMCS